MRTREVLLQAAIVDRKEAEERFRFFENVAVNPGVMLGVFTEFSQATDWLLSDE